MSCSFTLDLIFLFPHDVFVGQQAVIVMLSSLNDKKMYSFSFMTSSFSSLVVI